MACHRFLNLSALVLRLCDGTFARSAQSASLCRLTVVAYPSVAGIGVSTISTKCAGMSTGALSALPTRQHRGRWCRQDWHTGQKRQTDMASRGPKTLKDPHAAPRSKEGKAPRRPRNPSVAATKIRICCRAPRCARGLRVRRVRSRATCGRVRLERGAPPSHGCRTRDAWLLRRGDGRRAGDVRMPSCGGRLQSWTWCSPGRVLKMPRAVWAWIAMAE